jgi:hypothetical protein
VAHIVLWRAACSSACKAARHATTTLVCCMSNGQQLCCCCCVCMLAGVAVSTAADRCSTACGCDTPPAVESCQQQFLPSSTAYSNRIIMLLVSYAAARLRPLCVLAG